MLEPHWAYWFTALIPLGILGLMCFAIYGAGDRGYTPMSPDEEYRWLREECGLSHEDAEEIVNII